MSHPTPYGHGFVAATVTIATILACGVFLLVTRPQDPSATPAPTPALTPAPSAPSAAEAATCPTSVATSDVPTTKPPAVDTWEVSRRVVVPRSSTFGPATVDPDGFRRCFTHSPTGALYAAYNAIAALTDQRQATTTVTKLMVPSPDTDHLLKQLRSEPPDTHPDPTQPTAYRILDASPDRATVMLALPVRSTHVGATLTLAWHANDWRLVAPPPGQPVGTPYAQLRDLSGFVPWSGV